MLKDIRLKEFEFMHSCGYSKTEQFQKDLEKYRNTDYDENNKWYYII